MCKDKFCFKLQWPVSHHIITVELIHFDIWSSVYLLTRISVVLLCWFSLHMATLAPSIVAMNPRLQQEALSYYCPTQRFLSIRHRSPVIHPECVQNSYLVSRHIAHIRRAKIATGARNLLPHLTTSIVYGLQFIFYWKEAQSLSILSWYPRAAGGQCPHFLFILSYHGPCSSPEQGPLHLAVYQLPSATSSSKQFRETCTHPR